ncbi:hypothetical protein AB0M10_33925 [Streptomyces sp. NPDC051840]|uniref:hypothetical protein n=1 Tax=Streptomyces sp. NPDC051840 TaxID=3154752 RepID=UPI0034290BB1
MPHHPRRQTPAVLLGKALLTASVLLAVGCSSNADLDKASYTKGYEALGYAPTVQGDRQDIEHECDTFYGKFSSEYAGQKVVRADWVQGCADAAQNKESRF